MVAVLFIIGILMYIFYIFCFKQKSHLLTILLLLLTLIPIIGFIVNCAFLLFMCFFANLNQRYSDCELAEVKDTKFNRWLFNHLNWE